MNLLKSEGFSNDDLQKLTIGQMYDEAEMVVERQNTVLASQAIFIQAAIGSALSKDGAKAFKELIEQFGAN